MMTRNFFHLLSLTALSLFLFACEKEEEETKPELKNLVGTVDASGGEQKLKVITTASWTLKATSGDKEVDWIHFNPSSGAAGSFNVVMTVDKNTGGARGATITLQGPTLSRVKELQQFGVASGNGPLWLELPKMDRSNFTFGTHDMEGGIYQGEAKSGVRNYSFYWDNDGWLSLWVAYPLNKGLMGSGSYNYDWTGAYDPFIPEDKQSDLTSHSYGGYAWDNQAWQRGHLMARADRQTSQAAVKSTCRTTNMAPQCGAFNGGIWGNLEGQVRSWAKGTNVDTLFVVTGSIQEGSTTYTSDYYQPAVKVPRAFFKALLRMKNKNEFSMKAFWFPHTEDAYKGGEFSGNYRDYEVTVAELEKKANIVFFENLSKCYANYDEAKVAEMKNTIANW